MSAQQTRWPSSLEKARSLGRARSPRISNWASLYLAARRFPEAATALDRVLRPHPDYPMALFKRAQVSVLLHEPDLRGADCQSPTTCQRDDGR